MHEMSLTVWRICCSRRRRVQARAASCNVFWKMTLLLLFHCSTSIWTSSTLCCSVRRRSAFTSAALRQMCVLFLFLLFFKIFVRKLNLFFVCSVSRNRLATSWVNSAERLFVRVYVGTLGVGMLRLKHLFGIWQLARNSKHKFVAKDFLISKSLFYFLSIQPYFLIHH